VGDGAVRARAGALLAEERLCDQLAEGVSAPAFARHQHHRLDPALFGLRLDEARLVAVEGIDPAGTVGEVLVAVQLLERQASRRAQAHRAQQLIACVVHWQDPRSGGRPWS